MNETTLTNDERECLRTWMRQAIAQIETQEATTRFIQSRKILEGTPQVHRESVTRRRGRRTIVTTHDKELVN
jgi:hypothetical protein